MEQDEMNFNTDKMPEVMIDLETLGTGDDAMVVSIGLVAFDSIAGRVGAMEEISINPLEAVGEIDASTVIWWLHQGKAAQEATFKYKGNQVSSVDGLIAVVDFVHRHCSGMATNVWANGPTFDITKLERLFKKFDINIPWGYNAARDLRTVRQIGEEFFPYMEIPTTGVQHSALDDAYWQASMVIKFFASVAGVMELQEEGSE